MEQTLTAYDYDAQEWTTGERARTLLIAQLRETLEILESPRGTAYLVMTRRRDEPAVSLEYAIHATRRHLAELGA